MTDRKQRHPSIVIDNRGTIQRMEDSILPANPLADAMSRPVLSVSALVNRMRARAVTSNEAYDVYRELIISRIRQQADVLMQGGELQASAKKREQLDLYTTHGHEVSARLYQRLEAMVRTMTDHAFDAALAAEQEAERRAAELSALVKSGAISDAASRRLLRLAKQQRDYKCAATVKRCAEFLNELDRQIASTMQSMQSNRNL